ncbi:MAG: hypothetical protein AB9882_04030 [Ignavibacteriaceae bacterium]
MAILKENPFGILSGRVGDLIFRNIRGRVIVCKRPEPSSHPPTEKALIARRSFKNCARFAKYLNSIPVIHSLFHPLKKAAFQSIMKANARTFVDFAPSVSSKIAPSGDFDLYIFYNKLSDRSIDFTFIQIPDSVTPLTKSIQMICVHTWLSPFQPEGVEPFESFFSVHNFSYDDLHSNVSHTIRDKVSPVSCSDHYSRKILFYFFIIHNPNGVVLHSDSYSTEV